MEADLIVYGGTSAGIAAGIQACRMGYKTIVVEPSTHIGGLTTGGLGQTDIGNKQVVGGIAREFYQAIRAHYATPDAWIWQKPDQYRDGGQTKTSKHEDAMWTFEPSAASTVLKQMIQKADLKVITGERLNRSIGVVKNHNRIVSIQMESGLYLQGRVFIDATYEGDLMAASGVTYFVGRESNAVYNETLSGIQTGRYAPTLSGKPIGCSANHQLARRIDPYRIEGDPSSGLLPGIRPDKPGVDGDGDAGVQAYCYRACLTNHPENRIPFPKPDNYDQIQYEILFRHLEKDPAAEYWNNSSMPNCKTDTNNGGGFSSDLIGGNHAYPDADYKERQRIADAHRDYQIGLYWTLANHPRIPAAIRQNASRWGLPSDEFTDNNNWSPQLYVREARRMIGRIVMTQHHSEGLTLADKPIGMAAYGMDSHNVWRYVDVNGYVCNEGNVEASVEAPYPIGMDALLPADGIADNLIVPVCLSASHIAYGSIRMEPVFMVLGQSAATIAVHSIEENCLPAEIQYPRLAERLQSDGQVLRNLSSKPELQYNTSL